MTVQLQKATQYHYYRTVLAIFPLAPDQTSELDEASLQVNCNRYRLKSNLQKVSQMDNVLCS